MNESEKSQVTPPPPAVATTTAQTPSTSSPAEVVEQTLNPFYHLKHAWILFTKRWKTYIAIQLLSIVISLPFLYYLPIERGNLEILVHTLMSLIIPVSLIFILIMFILFLSQLALMVAVFRSDQNVGAVESFKVALRQFLPYSGFALLQGLLIYGALLFFFIPGLLFSLWFSFGSIIYLTENEKAFSSLLKSREYVLGHLLPVFVCLVVYWVVIFLITYVPSEIVSLITHGDKQVDKYMNILTWPLNFIITPFALLYTLSIYKSLKSMKKDPIVLPSKKPYIITALLGYVVFGFFCVLIIMTLVPILKEVYSSYSNHKTQVPVSNEKTDERKPQTIEKVVYSKQFAQANNVSRRSAATMYLNGIGQYQVEHDGKLPKGITEKKTEISSMGADLCSALIPVYLPELPVDPSLETKNIADCSKPYSTGYFVFLNNGKVSVTAPSAELDKTIEASR